MNDKTQIEALLRNIEISESRLGRFVDRPLKTGLAIVSRKSGLTMSVECPLIWGDTFKGVLPEAVTSLVWRYKCYELSTSRFISKYLAHGGVFLDIGAHFGYFTILSSRIVGRGGKVVSIEAMPSTYRALMGNIVLNGLENVVALNCAAADETKIYNFTDFGVVDSSLNTMFNPRGKVYHDRSKAKDVEVHGRRVDDVLSELGVNSVDMIKIDTESSEHIVLSGLTETIRNNTPIVLVELGGGDETEYKRVCNIVSIMQGFGYNLYNYKNGSVEKMVVAAGLPYMNGVFLHKKHNVLFQIDESLF